MTTRIKGSAFGGAPTLLLSLLCIVVATGCRERATPRPYGYFRVDLPPHAYTQAPLDKECPYRFEMPVSAQLLPRHEGNEKYWFDLHYPTLNANVHCSYKPVRADLFHLVEDTRKIVYKHTVKADEIVETPYENSERRVYGILYEIKGNAASPLQFVLTDSVKHFFRGALYFDNVPNKDSIAPMAHYVQEDMVHLIETFAWK